MGESGWEVGCFVCGVCLCVAGAVVCVEGFVVPVLLGVFVEGFAADWAGVAVFELVEEAFAGVFVGLSVAAFAYGVWSVWGGDGGSPPWCGYG